MKKYSDILPVLNLHGTTADRQLISCFLSRLEGKSVIDQLKQQRIASIKSKLLLSCGGILLPFELEDKPSFGFECILNSIGTLFGNIKILGHELAHSFGYRIAEDGSLVRAWFQDPLAAIEGEKEEIFCDGFARAWLEQGNNRKEAERLIKEVFFKKEIKIF